MFSPLTAKRAGNGPAALKISSRTDREWLARWIVTRTEAGKSERRCVAKEISASTPPAEVPTARTSRLGITCSAGRSPVGNDSGSRRVPINEFPLPAGGEREHRRALSVRALRAAAPDAAITPADEFQALLVARPVLEVRELQFLLGAPALAGNAERLHLCGSFLQQAELVARVLLGAEPAVGRAGMAGNQPLPIHVDEAAAGHRPDRDRVDNEHDLLTRQPHHDVRVGVIEAEIGELQRGATELDRLGRVEGLVDRHHQRILQLVEPLLGAFVRNHASAGVLEGLAAGNVVEMMVAVDQIADRLVGDLLDLIDVVLHALRPRIADRISGDDAGRRDDEHRLRAAVAEDVDALGALDLGGRERRLLRLLWL